MIKLNLLGTPQLMLSGKPIMVSSAKAQALLFYLALTERGHSRLALSALLWPEKSEIAARTNLRQALTALRQAVPGLLITSRESVTLQRENVDDVDVRRFEEQARDGLAGDVDALQRAALLYQGDFLDGFHLDNAATFEEWMLLTKERLHKLAFQVLQQLTSYFVDNHNSTYGLRFAEQLLRLEPWHEETHYQLMQLLAWNGQSQAALNQFARCQQVLAQELNAEPSSKTLELAYAIQQRQVGPITQPVGYIGGGSPTPNSTKLGKRPVVNVDRNRSDGSQSAPRYQRRKLQSNELPRKDNLPTYLSTFIGRVEELSTLHNVILSAQPREGDDGALANVHEPMAKSRLITLVGPGGVGKTRLALHLANELAPHFPHGVWFVDLATLRDATLLAHAVAGALAIHENGEKPLLDTLRTELANRSLLLILDNCEHLIKDCAPFIVQLLEAAPTIRVLATSREPLNVQQERRFVVTPLRLPSPTTTESLAEILCYEGIHLFVDRALAIAPNFALTEQNRGALIDICRMLDGLPLATELVAARTRVLSIAQIAEQLRTEPMAQLRLAAQIRSDRQPRHRSLRSLIEWSYQLLSPAEQILLQRLTIFAGGCSFDAVEQICVDEKHNSGIDTPITRATILDLLEGLIDKSLVVVKPVNTHMRYHLLDSIRQFALEKLIQSGREEHLRDRHLAYCVQAMEVVEAKRTVIARAAWRQLIQEEIDNLRSALAWAVVSPAVVLGLRLTNALGDFWFTQGFHRESLHWIEQLLAKVDETVSPHLRLKALSNLEFTYWWVLEEDEKAQQIQQEALTLANQLGEQNEVEKMLNNLAGIALRSGDCARAYSYLHQSIALSAKSGHRMNYAWSHILLGEAAVAEGKHQQAEANFAQAMQELEQLSARNLMAYPMRRLGQLAQRRQNYRDALAKFQQSLQINVDVGQIEGQCASLASYARLCVELNEPTLAIRLCAVVNTTLHTAQIRLPFFERNQYTEMVQQFEANMPQNVSAVSWQKGSSLSIDDAIDLIHEWQRSKMVELAASKDPFAS